MDGIIVGFLSGWVILIIGAYFRDIYLEIFGLALIITFLELDKLEK